MKPAISTLVVAVGAAVLAFATGAHAKATHTTNIEKDASISQMPWQAEMDVKIFHDVLVEPPTMN